MASTLSLKTSDDLPSQTAKTRRWNDGMSDHFIVKAVSPGGVEMWLSQPRGQTYVVGPREKAVVFHSQPEASAAIDNLSEAFKRSGFRFHIEPPA
jgi:hypothetical protein